MRNLQNYRTVSSLYTPDTEFSGMHLMEIARGCGRGCRFCLAGYVYRPPREQPLDVLLGWAEEGLRQSQRIGLVSAAVSDHTQIDELATALAEMGAQISASSMRVDPISLPLIKAMRNSGAKTLTIAPEAGSKRLRDVISKTQTEEQLLAAVDLAQALDFPQLKLYFMIGHPTETQQDMEEMIEFMHTVRARFKRSIAINATPFVPKAHTPFQWMPMTDRKTLKKRHQFIQRQLGRHKIAVRSDSPSWAEVQGVLSRGDGVWPKYSWRLPQLTVRDFWATMADQGLDKDEFLGSRDIGAILPWHIVQSGVSDNYFNREWRLAEASSTGHHCPPDSAGCLSCQVCDPAWAFQVHRRDSAERCLDKCQFTALKTHEVCHFDDRRE